MLRLALPNKGRLSELTLELLDSAGLSVPTPTERALSARAGDGLEVLFPEPKFANRTGPGN